MTVEVITQRKDLPAIAEAWDSLAHEDRRDGFFRTFAWYSAWMEHIRPDAEPFVVVVRDGGQLVGLAPFCRLRYRDLGFTLRAIAWAGREVVSGDFLDFVCRNEKRGEVAKAVLKFVREASSHWGLLVAGELLKEGDSCRELDGQGRELGLSVRYQESRICPYIELPKTFDDYLGGMTSSMRYHVRRRIREVEKKGARLEVFSEPLEVAARVDTLIDLHLTRWRHDNLPGTFGRPGFPAFLRQICANPPSRSSSCVFQLTHEGTSVASLIMFYFGDSALYYQAGWDPHSPLAACSPGVVVMAHSIRHAIERGFHYYEFLRGDEAYKMRWTKTHRETTSLLLARSFAANRYLQLARIKDLLKTKLRGGASEPALTPATREDAQAIRAQEGGLAAD